MEGKVTHTRDGFGVISLDASKDRIVNNLANNSVMIKIRGKSDKK